MVTINGPQNLPRPRHNFTRNGANHTVSWNPNTDIGYVALILVLVCSATRTMKGRMWRSAAREKSTLLFVHTESSHGDTRSDLALSCFRLSSFGLCPV